jgi:hypothetical protein
LVESSVANLAAKGLLARVSSRVAFHLVLCVEVFLTVRTRVLGVTPSTGPDRLLSTKGSARCARRTRGGRPTTAIPRNARRRLFCDTDVRCCSIRATRLV